MTRSIRTILATLAVAALALAGAAAAQAAGTPAETTISNTASVEFTIGGVPSGPIPSDQVDFMVDHKIRVFVDNTGGTSVIAGGSSYALPFTIENQSNTAGGAATWFKVTAVDATGDFSMTGATIWEDTDGDGTPDVNLTDAIGAGQTAVYLSLTVNQIKNIMIVADTPNDATTRLPGKLSNWDLVAQAWSGNTDAAGALAQDSGGNDPAVSENVWADDAGTADAGGIDNTPADADGIHSDRGTYTTATPVSVDKEITGNGASGYNIPGDDVTYTITVTNADPANDATAVLIYDKVPDNTLYKSGSLSCSSGTAKWSTDNGGSYVTPEPAGTITHVECDGGTAAAGGGSATLTFTVTIN